MKTKHIFCGVISLAAVMSLIVIFYVGDGDREVRHSGNSGVSSTAAATNVDLACTGCSLILLNIGLLRADYVGLINPDRAVTPYIDGFFSNGIVFTDLSSGSGATYLSATATATGTETMFNEHRLWRVKRPGGGGFRILDMLGRDGNMLIDLFPTIAQVLSEQGYHTMSINQWIHTGRHVFLDRGFSDYLELPQQEEQLLFEQQIDIAIDKLEQRPSDPFFLYFHPNSLHISFHYPLHRAMSDREFFLAVENNSYVKGRALVIQSRNPTPPHPLADMIWMAYQEQVQYLDEQLERLFEYLQNKGLLKTTIVVLYSNHGLDVNKAGKLGTGLAYQPYLHVPLLMRHPNIDKGIRVEQMASLVDVAPTLYEMLRIEPDHDLSTFSLAPLINGSDYGREFAYSKDIQIESVRKGDWKLIITGGESKELYNLKLDLREQHNVYEDHRGIARELNAAAEQMKMRQLDYAKKMKTYFGVTL